MTEEGASEIWVEVDGIEVGLVDDARAVIVRGPNGGYVHDHSLCLLLTGDVILDRARFLSWVNRCMPLVRRALERGRVANSSEVDDWDFPDDQFAFRRSWFGAINEPAARIDVRALERDVLGRRAKPRPPADAPELTVVMGPVASGKTTLRRSCLASHVPIDPAELYLLLTIGDTKVPANIGRLLQETGRAVALAALRERRNVVVEVLPSRLAHPLVMDALPRAKALGYRTNVLHCDVPPDVSLDRNRRRAQREISALHTEIDAIGWLRHAIGEIEQEMAARRRSSKPTASNHEHITPISYDLPPVELLDGPVEQATLPESAVVEENERRLLQTMAQFGVRGEVVRILLGPVITTYEVEPAPGTTMARVASLADDLADGLASALEVPSVRVAAPIPGTSDVGFEIPNAVRRTVLLRDLVSDEAFQDSAMTLPLALGEDSASEAYHADLAKTPHLLVAGAAGTGKTVALNAMLASILYRATPDEARLILIDPKGEELRLYDGIPHLLLPVVTDMKKAALVLLWAVHQMERRYQLFAELAVRDIKSFNRKVEAIRRGEAVLPAALLTFGAAGDPDATPSPTTEPPQPRIPDRLPRIVVVVDELADLMIVAAKNVETAVARLAQKARAAGIHLILATQPPSVDVITDVIKANFPSRIAFRVSSRVDSRTILDDKGAEQLLGCGDMLFMPAGAPGPVRLHGAYASPQDVKRLTDFWRGQAAPVFDEAILMPRAEEPLHRGRRA